MLAKRISTPLNISHREQLINRDLSPDYLNFWDALRNIQKSPI